MKLKVLTGSTLAALCATPSAHAQTTINDDTAQPQDTIVVTGDFREESLEQIPSSISILDQQALSARGGEHLQDMLALVPNVNLSSGSNPARYFQIRGIGERSQFVEPVNISVGVLMDGIDMSGIGSGAAMMDVKQIEVFRGPQGTLFGANALAGLINVVSNDPLDEFGGSIETTLATDNTQRVTGVVSGPVNDRVAYRVAMQRNLSDGHITNDYLGRSDTNNLDEQFLRGRLRIDASDDLTLNLTGLYINQDNGYDSFSLDNNHRTRSDEPGHDRQETSALALSAHWDGFDKAQLELNTSYASSNLEYGYDLDWTYVGFHPDAYSGKDNYIRDRKNGSLDLRLISKPGGELFGGSTRWVTGVYLNEHQEDLLRVFTYQNADFSSTYETSRKALYGQLETDLSDDWMLITGLRAERWEADYHDSDNTTGHSAESLWGARLALQHILNDENMVYGQVSRGYKAGGFNPSNELSADERQFSSETLWNIELGLKGSYLDHRLNTQIAVFYQPRTDVQIKSFREIARSDGSTGFYEFFANSAKGSNYGLEAEFNWQLQPDLTLFGSLGLLQTELDEPGANYHKRDQGHAPNYQFALGANLELGDGWYTRVDVEGKDAFYFSDTHNERSIAYELLNARLGYRQGNWEASLWARNLTDEDYYVRGFRFGNDPRNGYIREGYYQLGDPRQIGITARYHF